jgi:hypothetical protein
MKRAVLTKAILIGRIYAVALERNKSERTGDNEDFYRVHVYNAFKKMDLQGRIERVRRTGCLSNNNIKDILGLHGYLVNGLFDLTKQHKRSFASKYLHFHLPDQMPILDSRALTALRKYKISIPAGWLVRETRGGIDETYAIFTYRILRLQEEIVQRHRMRLTLREMDKLLLYTELD